MEQNIQSPIKESAQIDLKFCFEIIGMERYFRLKSEAKNLQLQKINNELQNLLEKERASKD